MKRVPQKRRKGHCFNMSRQMQIAKKVSPTNLINRFIEYNLHQQFLLFKTIICTSKYSLFIYKYSGTRPAPLTMTNQQGLKQINNKEGGSKTVNTPLFENELLNAETQKGNSNKFNNTF